MDLSLAERIVGQSCSKTDNTAAAVVETPSGTKPKMSSNQQKCTTTTAANGIELFFTVFQKTRINQHF